MHLKTGSNMIKSRNLEQSMDIEYLCEFNWDILMMKILSTAIQSKPQKTPFQTFSFHQNGIYQVSKWLL
jgi:hypothetical protein